MWLLINHWFSNCQKKNNILRCSRWPILYGNKMVCSKHYCFRKWFLSSYLENAIRSAIKWKAINTEIMQWKTINKANKANLLSKHFWVRITIQDTKILFVGQPWWLTFFQGFFARGHRISNLNLEIGCGHENIISLERTPLDQNIGNVVWWQRCHVTLTNLNIVSYEWATIMKLDSRYTSWKRIHWTLLVSCW